MSSQFPPEWDRRLRGRRTPMLSAGIIRVAGEIGMAIAIAVMAAGAVAITRDLPAIQAGARRQLAEEIARENDEFCKRRGLITGTHQHLLCMMELNEIRNQQTARPTELELP